MFLGMNLTSTCLSSRDALPPDDNVPKPCLIHDRIEIIVSSLNEMTNIFMITQIFTVQPINSPIAYKLPLVEVEG